MMISDNFCINRIRLPKDGDHLRKTFFSPLCQVIGLIVLSILPSIWKLIIASMVAQVDNQWRLQQLSSSKRPWWHFSMSMSSRIHLLKQIRSNLRPSPFFFLFVTNNTATDVKNQWSEQKFVSFSWRTMILLVHLPQSQNGKTVAATVCWFSWNYPPKNRGATVFATFCPAQGAFAAKNCGATVQKRHRRPRVRDGLKSRWYKREKVG